MAAQRIDLAVVQPFRAPPDLTWAVVGDFHDSYGLGAGFVERVEVAERDGERLRSLHLASAFGGGIIVEREAVRDEPGRYYSYRLADCGSFPVSDYHGSVHVFPDGSGGSAALWTNSYVPNADPQDLKRQSLAILGLIEANTRAALERAWEKCR